MYISLILCLCYYSDPSCYTVQYSDPLSMLCFALPCFASLRFVICQTVSSFRSSYFSAVLYRYDGRRTKENNGHRKGRKNRSLSMNLRIAIFAPARLTDSLDFYTLNLENVLLALTTRILTEDGQTEKMRGL
jgi:hypothetical protein